MTSLKLWSIYNKTSIWCKILIFISLYLICLYLFDLFGLTNNIKMTEGFEQQDKFLIKTGPEIYDTFYADIYDYLVFNNLKDDYEIGYVLNNTSPSSKSHILDIGCGTGHHVASLGSKNLNVLGIDISPSMINKAKENFPNYNFQIGDATNSELFKTNTFTHILCMYFTFYYIKDRMTFLQNCFNWLTPGGYFIVHLVDRDKFDPILPPGNPLMYVSPQRYAKKRITSTKVKFHDFAYNADFRLDTHNNKANFIERFKDDSTGKIRKHEHILYMQDLNVIIEDIQSVGFFLESKADLLHCQYEYQYLYIFIKPN